MDPPTRTRTRVRTRNAPCPRHPNQPVTGLCALCLRDRLTYLDSSSTHHHIKQENIISFPLSRRTRRPGGPVPELCRSKSVAGEISEVGFGLSDLGRKSCDEICSGFYKDCSFNNSNSSKVGSKNLGVLSINEPVLEIIEDNDVRVSNGLFVGNEVVDNGEDLRTMKELIEMEFRNKKKKFWEGGFVLGQKLRKWRGKNKEKKVNEDKRKEVDDKEVLKSVQFKDVDYGLGRRSCDAAPRFLMEDPRFSLDERRADWDGYMIARTIPRLTPMLPLVDDDMILPPLNKRIVVDKHQMGRIKEDGSSSGGSAKSNSDLFTSNAGSSCSSMKSSSSKTVNDSIGQETKLVITERELKDWHMRSVNEHNVKSASSALISSHATVKRSNGHKKETNSRWRKMSNLWSYKYKHGEKKNGECIQESRPSLDRNNEISGVAKLVRNGSMVGTRNKSELHQNGEEGGRHSMSDIDNGLMKLYLSPLRKSKKSWLREETING
uniref:protein OCTOPUS-like n=1 Tax=Erigeron canadensis TaxID=72917 RepID=UPI001CB8C95A|nr:protein OCTOPUS-like [Erigeron canadensis]